MTPARQLLQLAPILGRIRRIDHWVVAKGSSPMHRGSAMTDALLTNHIVGATRVGACPMERGSSTTRLALLDLDDHNKEMKWTEVQDIASKIIDNGRMLEVEFIPFRSSGGRGMHLYAIWDEPQDARSVRAHLSTVLSSVGHSNGTKGLQANQVEVFPKQDSVPADGWGNMFVLPCAGNSESVPLHPDTLQVIHLADTEWPVSTPVPHAPAPQRPPVVVEPGSADISRVRSALMHLDPNEFDYDGWIRLVMAVSHGTNGSAAGHALIHEWSSQFVRYDPVETDKQWNWAKPDKPGGITVNTLFAEAHERGWFEPPNADGFYDITPEGLAREARAIEDMCSVREWFIADVAMYSEGVRQLIVEAAPRHIQPELAAAVRAQLQARGVIDDAKTSANRFAITRIGEFAKLKPVSWHIKGVLPAEGVAFVYGPPGSGKTFWALDIAGTVARGADRWRGHRVKATAVVYVAGEGSTGVRQRAAAYLRENDLPDARIGIIDDVPNLFAEKTHAGLLAQRVNEAAATLGKVGIIILDTLAATTPGANENAGEDMGLVLSRVHELQKATGALVLIVHHSGKDDSRGLRGWSGLLGAADAVFKVEKDDSGLRQVIVEKLKDGSADGKYGFRLKSVHLGEDEDGDAINSCVVEQTEDTIEPKRGRTREQPLELPAEAQDERLVRMGKDQKLAFEQLKLLAEQKGQVQYERKEAIATLGELCKREGWQPRRITDKGTEVVEGLIKRGILKPLDSDWLLFQLDPVEAPSLAVSDDGGGKDEL